MRSIADRIKGFDWYYNYSDDARVYRKAKAEWEDIQKLLKDHSFDFNYNELMAWAFDYIDDEMVPYKNGKGKPEWLHSQSIAPILSNQIISRARYEEIDEALKALGSGNQNA